MATKKINDVYHVSNTGVINGEANDPNAVHFTAQTLTAEQQEQARTNIGAAADESTP